MSVEDNTERILERLARKKFTPRQAIALLIAQGFGSVDAGETILFTLGGSDLVETGPDEVRRYQPSGCVVATVQAAMKE